MAYSFVKDQMKTTVCADRAELGALAGNLAADFIRRAIADRGEARVIFAAAPSQNETLAALVAAEGIDWAKVVALHMDEYVGLPIGSKARFSRYLKDHIFEKVPFKAIYYIDEERGEGVDALISRYEKILAEGPVDLVCMGIGENGHVAFNDPPVADFRDPKAIKLVELDDVCRRQQVNDGCFPDFDSTPSSALTLTVPSLARGAARVCAVPGKLKAGAVKKTLEDPVSEACPATILRTLPNSFLFVDADSFSETNEPS
ncbi:MAG: glucosamine-6-phosphate deaminase [Thermoguttaceae bacterium]|nr:glucosamine-6-phosphate deaminase [Thermoguttaceae bacterium]